MRGPHKYLRFNAYFSKVNEECIQIYAILSQYHSNYLDILRNFATLMKINQTYLMCPLLHHCSNLRHFIMFISEASFFILPYLDQSFCLDISPDISFSTLSDIKD
jgi:hypothetical protein